MHAPDAAELRPGDLVKLRRTVNPVHTGSRAVVVGTHRSPTPPFGVVALDVRYTARGAAVRVELAGPGELVRYEDPWPVTAPVQRVETAVLTAPEAAPRVSRRRVLVAGLVLALPLAGLGAWYEHAQPERRYAASTRAAVAAGGLDLGTTGASATGTADPSDDPSAGPTSSAATSRVVGYASDGVPLVEGADGSSRPVPLAGVAPVRGCAAGYARDLRELLPVGASATVTGSGWYRTAAGVDVNAELVRRGHAVPSETGTSLSTVVSTPPADCS